MRSRTVKRSLRPELVGDWWLIGPSPPELDALLPRDMPVADSDNGADQSEYEKEHNAPVDHHILSCKATMGAGIFGAA